MKSVIGAIIVLIGLAMTIFGVGGFMQAANRENSLEHKIGSTVSSEYRENHDSEKMTFGGVAIVGVVLLFYGFSVRRSASREKLHKRHHKELKDIAAANQSNNTAPAPPPLVKKSEDDKLEKLKKLGELKDSGVLTQEEFEKEKAKLL